MLRLGHIIYSNCFPVHAGILTGAVPFPFKIVEGIPTELNRLLAEGKIHVSPSSSVEYAMNPGRYLILPDLSITARRKASSVILRSRVPLLELTDRPVALTTASATSVVLLRILLELQHGITPDYFVYEQGAEDPSDQAFAMLMIGDLALKQVPTDAYPHLYDLGELWHAFTGLPFVFALWQVNYRKNIQRDMEAFSELIQRSKRYGMERLPELAAEHAARFGIPAPLLAAYWQSFSYDLGAEEQKGLAAYYGYAAELGAIPAAPELHFWGIPNTGGNRS